MSLLYHDVISDMTLGLRKQRTGNQMAGDGKPCMWYWWMEVVKPHAWDVTHVVISCFGLQDTHISLVNRTSCVY